MNTDHEIEPVPGLPENLPSGERILWQGAPRWTGLARRAFHARTVAIYFGLLVLWRLVDGLVGGESVAALATAMAWMLALGLAGVGLLCLLAWLHAWSSLYTITNKRIVLRIGVAIPITMNLPFSVIASADFRDHGDGTGDIPIRIGGEQKVSWLLLWPNVKPWRMSRPEPMLRAVPDAQRAADILSNALLAAQEGQGERTAVAGAAARSEEDVDRSAAGDPGRLMPAAS